MIREDFYDLYARLNLLSEQCWHHGEDPEAPKEELAQMASELRRIAEDLEKA